MDLEKVSAPLYYKCLLLWEFQQVLKLMLAQLILAEHFSISVQMGYPSCHWYTI